MRILFLSHYFPPEGNAPASRVHSMCRRWVESGHEVTVVTCAPNVPTGIVYEGYRNAWHQEEIIDGIHVVRTWTLLAANRAFGKRVLNYLSFFVTAVWRAIRLPPADVVIATSPQFFCGWAGVWTARLKRCPFVLEIRDLWPESILAVRALRDGRALGPRRLILRYLEWLERRMYRAAGSVVTVGEGYRKGLLARGVPDGKLSVITNGVESAFYRPREADPQRRAEAGAAEGDFLVGYIGTVGMAHALEVVIEAGRIARDRGLERLRFVVVGDGARRDALLARLEADDPGNVRFLGWRPKDHIPAWIASVDACLVHLRSGALFTSVLPSKIFEALAMKRPILLGVRGEAEKFVRSAGGGLCFEPEDAEHLVDAAVELMRFPDRGAGLGRIGREEVLSRFDLNVLADRYATILTTLESKSADRLAVQ